MSINADKQAGDTAAAANSDSLVVDLGYQLNQGKRTRKSRQITFRNIRYAAAPLGPLRFQAPAPPPTDRSTVQDHTDVIPPQAYPSWLITGSTEPVTAASLPPTDPRASEDCLFLDVLMPASIWENRYKSKASVLFWIPGGGFDVGWKDASGAGEGLVARSMEDDREGVILVSINYRLGLFGWMHGAGVTSNAGLLDQRFALEWVQAHIGRFGGDKNKVTILAESAGAGSAMAHITAYGGANDSPPPFISAIIQSPYLPPKHLGVESSVDGILKYGNIASVDALRAKSSEELQQLNALIVGNAEPFGNFVFGIVVDGEYVPDLPSRLLLQGCFDKNISVMTGHVQDEGSRFIPSSQVTDECEYRDFLMATFPSLATSPPTQLDVLTKKLYPPIFDGTQGYTNQTERNNLTIADAMIICNARSLNVACFGPTGYAYEYTVPPAVHGADLAYTFYDGPSSISEAGDVNATVATILQKYITNFARGANPNGGSDSNLPHFPPVGTGRTIQNIGIQGIGPKVDEGGREQVEARHQFWQNAPYLD